MSNYEVQMFFLYVLLIFGPIVIWFAFQNDRKRKEARKITADQLGFTYSEKGESLDPSIYKCPLLKWKHHGINAIHGSYANFKNTAVFERLGGGNNKGEYTIVAFQIDRQLPTEFVLRPNNIATIMFLKLEKLNLKQLNFKKLNFPGDEKFNAAYMTFCKETINLDELFNQSLREELLTLKSITIEGAGNWLLFYQTGSMKRIKTDLKSTTSYIEKFSQAATKFNN